MPELSILQVTRGNTKLTHDTGSVESIILNISKNLSLCKHYVTILIPRDSDNGSIINLYDRVNIVSLPSRKYKLSFLTWNRLSRCKSMIINFLDGVIFAYKTYRYIKSTDFDVIHWHTTLITCINMILNKDISNISVFTSHSSLISLDPSSLDIFNKIKLGMDVYVFRCVSKIIVLNDCIKERIVSRYKIDPNKIVTIPNGTDVDIFNVDTNTTYLRSKYNIDGKVVILFVGRIHEVKGLNYLVKATNILVNRCGIKNIAVLIIGSSGNIGLEKDCSVELSNLIHTYKLDDYFLILGHKKINELIGFYSMCDIFIMPSLNESFCLAVTEAMSSGKPIIGTRTDGVSSQVIDGTNGFLVDIGDEFQLADKIKCLLEDPSQIDSMGRNSRKIVMEKFDWEKISAKIIDDVYLKIGNKT